MTMLGKDRSGADYELRISYYAEGRTWDRTKTSVIATREGGGRWTFRLDDGAAWTQVDSEALMLPPRAGMRVDIRKGMVGSYFLGLDGHAGVRVRRVQ